MNACAGRTRFRSASAARHAAERGITTMRAVACRQCGGWHLEPPRQPSAYSIVRGCTRKRRYAAPEDAVASQHEVPMRAYACRWCGG